MLPDKKIRWGIIGLGHIAHQFASDLLLIDDAQLHAVASRDKNKAAAFARKFSSIKSYDSYQDLLLDDEIDIVYIATPHSLHAVLTIQALNHGKHVLCEKPVALNANHALAMIKASITNNKFFMEAFWTRFNPSFCSAFEKIKNAEIGSINYINADFAFLANDLNETTSRKTDLNLGGGALLDVGVYPLFLAYMVLGLPKRITAKSIFHESGADLQTTIMLEYDQAHANLFASFVSSSRVGAAISGTKGRIEIGDLWYKAQSYNLTIGNDRQEFSMPTNGLGFSYEIEECHRCIRAAKIESDLWSHQNTIDLISLVDRVRSEIGLVYPDL